MKARIALAIALLSFLPNALAIDAKSPTGSATGVSSPKFAQADPSYELQSTSVTAEMISSACTLGSSGTIAQGSALILNGQSSIRCVRPISSELAAIYCAQKKTGLNARKTC